MGLKKQFSKSVNAEPSSEIYQGHKSVGRCIPIRLGQLQHYQVMKKSIYTILPLTALALSAVPASATVVFTGAGSATEVSSSIELAYAADVSNSDLIEGVVPAITGWNIGNGAHPDQLTDGVHGGSFFDVGNMVEGGWTTVGATAEYSLGTGANGLGYDITSIQSIAAWVNVGFGDQAWTVDVRPVGGSFSLLATVDYDGTTDGGATKVNLTGLDPSGIDAIRFTANNVNSGANGGAFLWREIDVFGTDTVAIPEPSSAVLLGLGGVALFGRRRRKSLRR